MSPDNHYLGYYLGTPSFNQISASRLTIGGAPADPRAAILVLAPIAEVVDGPNIEFETWMSNYITEIMKLITYAYIFP